MPRIYKSGKEFKGNKNSGTKTKYQFAAEIINNGLANNIANEELIRIKNTRVRKREDLKEIVMPVVLKGIKEVKDFNVYTPSPILNGLSNVHSNDSDKQTIKSDQKD